MKASLFYADDYRLLSMIPEPDQLRICSSYTDDIEEVDADVCFTLDAMDNAILLMMAMRNGKWLNYTIDGSEKWFTRELDGGGVMLGLNVADHSDGQSCTYVPLAFSQHLYRDIPNEHDETYIDNVNKPNLRIGGLLQVYKYTLTPFVTVKEEE